MAEGLLNALGNNDYEVYSAGINPSEVNPYAIKPKKPALFFLTAKNIFIKVLLIRLELRKGKMSY